MKTGRRYDRNFKTSVLKDLEAGKPLIQVAHEYGIHPSLPDLWKTDLAEDPEKGSRGDEGERGDQARIAELERLLGQANAEIELLKKSHLRKAEQKTGEEAKTSVEKRYMIINEAQSDGFALSISCSCRALGVSRSGYYEWLKRSERSEKIHIRISKHSDPSGQFHP